MKKNFKNRIIKFSTRNSSIDNAITNNSLKRETSDNTDYSYEKKGYSMAFSSPKTAKEDVLTENTSNEYNDFLECPDCSTPMDVKMFCASAFVSETTRKLIVVGKDKCTCPNCGKTIIKNSPKLFGTN